jgi:hypothetical protein
LLSSREGDCAQLANFRCGATRRVLIEQVVFKPTSAASKS